MGRRYLEALNNLKIQVDYICDIKKKKIKKNIIFEKNYKKTLNVKVDLVCIVAIQQ